MTKYYKIYKSSLLSLYHLIIQEYSKELMYHLLTNQLSKADGQTLSTTFTSGAEYQEAIKLGPLSKLKHRECIEMVIYSTNFVSSW